jgi:hypothetical protein
MTLLGHVDTASERGVKCFLWRNVILAWNGAPSHSRWMRNFRLYARFGVFFTAVCEGEGN